MASFDQGSSNSVVNTPICTTPVKPTFRIVNHISINTECDIEKELCLEKISNAVELFTVHLRQYFNLHEMQLRDFHVINEKANFLNYEDIHIESCKHTVNNFFIVGKDVTVKAFTENQNCYYMFPIETIRLLPNIIDSEVSILEKRIHGDFLGFLVHEMFHALGAYHSSFGVMSGRLCLLDMISVDIQTDFEPFDFEANVDPCTMGIIFEALGTHAMAAPIVKTNYNASENKLRLESADRIAAYFFIHEQKYTTYSQFDHENDSVHELNITVPPLHQWDAFSVVLSGCTYYITQTDLLGGKDCTRISQY